MSYALYLALTLATTGRDDLGDAAESTPARADVLEPALGCLRAVAEGLRRGPVSPLVAAQFEKALQQATRALGRVVTPWASNHAEPAVAAALPRAVHFEGSSCRRLAQQTPQQVSTFIARHPARANRSWSRSAGPWDWCRARRPPGSNASPATWLKAGPRPSGRWHACVRSTAWPWA